MKTSLKFVCKAIKSNNDANKKNKIIILLIVAIALIACYDKEITFSETKNNNGIIFYKNKEFTGKTVDRWENGLIKELKSFEVGKLKKLEEFNIEEKPEIIVNYNVENGDIISFEHITANEWGTLEMERIDFIDGKPDIKYRFKKFVDYWVGDRRSIVMAGGTAIVGTFQGDANFQFVKNTYGVQVDYSASTFSGLLSASEYGEFNNLKYIKGFPFKDKSESKLYDDYYFYSSWKPEKSGGGSFYLLLSNKTSKKKIMDLYILGKSNFQYQVTVKLDEKEYNDIRDIFIGNKFNSYQKYLKDYSKSEDIKFDGIEEKSNNIKSKKLVETETKDEENNKGEKLDKITTNLKIPEGWRAPNKNDVNGDWAVHKKEDYIPYYFTSDFDQNGLLDEAWILIKNDGTSFGIWGLLRTKDSQLNYLIKEEKNYLPQGIGISETLIGTFKTACGKGYYDCESGEPSEIEVTSPQIWYSPFDSGPGFIAMWDEKEMIFRKYQMND